MATPVFENLDGHQYMSLTTFRKTGEGVPTPVWFANEGGKLYLLTLNNAGKLKRIRNNASVTVAPCTVRGDVLGELAEGTARILDGDEATRANALLTRKYGFFKRGFDLMHWLTGNLKSRTYLEISPR
jgi:hypothetical protein